MSERGSDGSRDAAADRETPTYPIGSVDSALRLLLMFGERAQVRVADAATELGVARSTAHRLLQMLLFYGFVRQDPETRTYAAGPVWVTLGLQGVRDLDIRAVARPELEGLVEAIGETVQLLVLQPGGEVVCLDAVECNAVVRAAGRIGSVYPAHGTAGGRALLSTLPEGRVAELYPEKKLSSLAANKIRTRAALERELADIRANGYAVQRDEFESGVSAIAALIPGAGSEEQFAIDVVMPSSRLAGRDIDAIAAEEIAAAAQIAARLS